MNDKNYERLEANINRTLSFLLLRQSTKDSFPMFVYVRSVFDVIKTDINNIDEENGYCVMMVLADSKNVIKIFFSSSFFVFSFYYPSFFCCCAHQNQ
jgi:hypothetical protein